MLTPMIIGYKITEARKKNNISQAQLAQNLFISPQAVGKWERGESLPDIIMLNRLAEILGVDLNYFSENFISSSAETVSAGEKKKKPGWNMSFAQWTDGDFSGLKNLNEKFSASNMKRCLFIGSELSGLLLKNNNVENCDFSQSDISGSRFRGSSLTGNIFKKCSMKDTELTICTIKGCDFTEADFSGAVIKYSTFEKNSVTDTVWKETAFNNTQFSDIVFEGTIEDCRFENCAFTKVTFRNTTLVNTFFKNKTMKKVRFIDCLADRLTMEFLKNGKADLTGITSLTF